MGVRWLRAPGGPETHKLAHELGFFTWYQNSIAGPDAHAYLAGTRVTWINEEKNRVNWLRSNLQRVKDQGDLVFEFSNEWNLHGGERKGLLAEKYVKDWLVPLKRLRDAEFSSIELAGGVVGNADDVYLEKVYKAGGWPLFDILDLHAAGSPRSADFDDGNTYWSYLAALRGIREILRKYGAKELWLSEFYSPVAPNSSCSNNERVAAQDLTLQIVLAIAADVRGFMYYCFDDFDRFGPNISSAETIGEPADRECYFGLIRRDWTPKATLWAYATAAWYLEGAKFLGDVAMPKPWLHGLLFEGRRGKVAVLWSRQEGYLLHEPAHPRHTHPEPWEPIWTDKVSVPLKSAGKTITVVDCVGRARTLQPDKDGMVTVELDGAPLYVLGVELAPSEGHFSRILRPRSSEDDQ
jgi:hypothetical protein